jgi:hypothetical protein
MRRFLHIPVVAALLALSPPLTAADEALNARVTTAFNADCETLRLKELKRAKSEVLIAVYSLTRRR